MGGRVGWEPGRDDTGTSAVATVASAVGRPARLNLQRYSVRLSAGRPVGRSFFFVAVVYDHDAAAAGNIATATRRNDSNQA